MSITRESIAAAAAAIRPYIRRTPVVELTGAELHPDAPADAAVHLKLDLMQHSGSFKVRGAFANMLQRNIPPAGVVAASGGNHGAAVAYAARQLSVPAKIFVPRISSHAKVSRIRGYGADLVVTGDRYADALAASETWAASNDALPLHAFDSVHTITGQGTVGMELSEQVPQLDTVLVAVGGGGLLAGVASWYGATVKVIGVEPLTAPTLTRAREAGAPVDAEAGGIAADSLAPLRIGSIVFPITQQHVADVLLVSDDAIREAQDLLWRVLRVVAEPGGVTALSAVTSGVYRPRAGERIGVVVSGGNTTAVEFDSDQKRLV